MIAIELNHTSTTGIDTPTWRFVPSAAESPRCATMPHHHNHAFVKAACRLCLSLLVREGPKTCSLNGGRCKYDCGVEFHGACAYVCHYVGVVQIAGSLQDSEWHAASA